MEKKTKIIVCVIASVAVISVISAAAIFKMKDDDILSKEEPNISGEAESQKADAQETMDDDQPEEIPEAMEINEAQKTESTDPAKTSEDDPGNMDPIDQAAKNKKNTNVDKNYIGNWKEIGLMDAGGQIVEERSFDQIRINSDKTYVYKAGNEEGGSETEKGKWYITKRKTIMLGAQEFGINDSGYLLMDSGERSGKGLKMYNAFKKMK